MALWSVPSVAWMSRVGRGPGAQKAGRHLGAPIFSAMVKLDSTNTNGGLMMFNDCIFMDPWTYIYMYVYT